MSILWAIVAGLIIGSLARLVVRGPQAIPLWLTILVGVAGALIGNWLASAIGVRHTSGVDWIRHLLQVGVAAALVAFVTPLWARRGTGP